MPSFSFLTRPPRIYLSTYMCMEDIYIYIASRLRLVIVVNPAANELPSIHCEKKKERDLNKGERMRDCIGYSLSLTPL